MIKVKYWNNLWFNRKWFTIFARIKFDQTIEINQNYLKRKKWGLYALWDDAIQRKTGNYFFSSSEQTRVDHFPRFTLDKSPMKKVVLVMIYKKLEISFIWINLLNAIFIRKLRHTLIYFLHKILFILFFSFWNL